nr:hypothetical protein [Tanacetum cinerariifolium]
MVTTDVPEIYMQEFWATATVHHHSIHFKMNNKKCIVNLEYFREMMHICLRLPNQTFYELPFEEEILEFLRYLRHNGEIKKITAVNINKLHQPWRSFTAVINKCLSGKSTGYDSLRLSQAQILWEIYHKKNVDFAYLLNSTAYKEYYAVNSGAAPPKTKASVEKTRSSFDTRITPPTVAGTRLLTSAKSKQHAKSSKAKGLSVLSEVAMTKFEQIKLATKRSLQQTHISQASGSGADEGTGILPDDDDDDEDNDEEEELAKSDEEDKESGKGGDEVRESEGESDEEETRQEEEESFDPIPRTPEESEEESNDEEEQDLRLSEEARIQEEEDTNELYRDVNINQGRGLQVTKNVKDTHVTLTPVNLDGPQESPSMSSFVSSMLNPINDVGVESIFMTTSSPIVSPQSQTPIMTPSTIATITTSGEAPIPPQIIPNIILENLPTFNSTFRFEESLRSLETSFFEYRQTNPFADAVSAIPGIVQQ